MKTQSCCTLLAGARCEHLRTDSWALHSTDSHLLVCFPYPAPPSPQHLCHRSLLYEIPWVLSSPSICTHLWDAYSYLLKKYNLLKKNSRSPVLSPLTIPYTVVKYGDVRLRGWRETRKREKEDNKKCWERGEPQTGILPSSVCTLFSPGCKESVVALRETSLGLLNHKEKGNKQTSTNKPTWVCFLVNKGKVLLKKMAFLDIFHKICIREIFWRNMKRRKQNPGWHG